jgi:hypothetical protein
MEKKSLFGIRYTIKPEDILPFIAGLREVQEDMIESVMTKKEQEGFPEANAVIQYIMEKK